MKGFEKARKAVWIAALVAGVLNAQTWAAAQNPAPPPNQGQGQGPGGRQGPGRGGPGRQGPNQGAVSPAELQELMDAMVLVRAEQELQLSDTQFAQFLTRFKGLQAARRRAENMRNRSLMELRRLVQNNAGEPDENQLRERLKALDDGEVQAATEVRQARTNLAQILNVRQQARFRLLEEQVDRRKLELFARSRVPAPPQ